MTDKKSQPFPDADEERELEEKVKQMLDPSVPDDAPANIKVINDDANDTAAVSDLPDKIEIVGSQPDEVKTAPPLDKKITVKHFDEEEPKASEVVPTETDESTGRVGNQVEDASAGEDPETEAADLSSVETGEIDSPAETSTADKDLDTAVDDIVASESDKLLEEEDKDIAKAFDDKKPSFGAKVKGFFSSWWHNKAARRLTILVLLLALVAAAVVPTTRYVVLNTFGVRSSASVSVIDKSTLQPLKNVTVTIHGQSATTDNNGNVTVNDIKLGDTSLIVERRAFAVVERKVTIGWGSNPLGRAELEPVGTQYSFMVKDFVSGKPLHKIEAISGDASAFSDEAGLLKLTLDMPEDVFKVQLIGEGLRMETLEINADDMSERTVQMVAAKKHVYISKRNGQFDVFAAYADGKQEELVLAGTGAERDDMTLVPHPEREVVALVSTRSNERNEDGFLLSDLTVIDLEDTDNLKQVSQSERVQIIGWADERLVYVQIAAGTSAANPDRHRLKTYNLNEDTDAELASTNYFNDVMIAKDIILYAPSSAYAKAPSSLFRVKPDGSDTQIVHPAEVWSMFRTGHNTIVFTTGRDWHSFSIDNLETEQLDGEPANIKSRAYIDNNAGTSSLWVDQRDGKGVLLATNVEDGEDTVIQEQSGLKLPVYWLNDSTIVFRIATDEETADYVVSTNGGEPKKLADVTNTAGLDRWYYY